MEAPKQYVHTEEDFEIAKEIALKIADQLHTLTKGHMLITLQALDIVQDGIIQQALGQIAAHQAKSSEASQG